MVCLALIRFPVYMTCVPPSQPFLKCSLELLKHGAKHAPALEAHKSSMTDTLVRASAMRYRCGAHALSGAGCAEEASRP